MSAVRVARDDAAIARALAILQRRFAEPGAPYVVGAVGDAQAFARLKLAGATREAFAVIFLDAQLRVIGYEELFQGTLTRTFVQAREVARAALKHNAAGVILVHNHPSGRAEFSVDDECLTASLREVLELIEVKVIDHLLVAGPGIASLVQIEALRRLAVEQQPDRAPRAAPRKAAGARQRRGEHAAR